MNTNTAPMLRSNRVLGKWDTLCPICKDDDWQYSSELANFTRRYIKRRERQEWKREVAIILQEL